MGTRSTTRVYEDGRLLLSLYKQMDGYPDGWGKDLKDFIRGGKFINGIGAGTSLFKHFNGAGDFALQLVLKYKDGIGEIYATTATDREEYNYRIDVDHKKGSVFMENPTVKISCAEEPSFNEVMVREGTAASPQSKGVVKVTGHKRSVG